MAKRPPAEDAVTAYARQVTEGRMVSGRLVRLAAERHLRDMTDGPARGLRFDLVAANRAIDFFPAVLVHSKGALAGQPFLLLDWQKFVIGSLFGWKRGEIRRFRTAFVSTARKNGKMLANDTPVPTPKGWKRHGELQPGDFVFGRHGRPIRVLAVTEEYCGPGYRVAFSDGTAIVAHACHEWQTQRTAHTRRSRAYGWLPAPNLETQEIARTLRHSARGDLTHGIPVALPLDTGPDISLPLPPYTLGVWLGDGSSLAAVITSADLEVVAGIEADGVPIALRTSQKTDGNKARTYTLADTAALGLFATSGKPAMRVGFEGCLRDLRIRGDKAVPGLYLRSSIRQRRELLAGIVDSDGHVTPRGQCEVVLTNRKLFDGVVELTRTLGFKPTVVEDRAQIKGQDKGPRYRMQFWPLAADLPLRIERKRNNLRSSPMSRSRTRMIVSCDPVGEIVGKCIQVEGGTYLAGLGMVPTHNSTLEAGIGLKALIDEGEAGAEVYSAATTRDQARIVFSEAERMRVASPALRRRITATTNNLAVIDTASWFRPLSADASKMDGLNVFVALVDEVHEHPNAEVIEKLDTGMGARAQPIMYETTTAGVNRNSICYQHWDFSTKVLERSIPEETADRWFAYIATVDEDDDWQDELAWKKANPSLGPLLRIEDLRAEVAIAREMPSKQNSIRRLRLNQWCVALGTLILMADGALKRADELVIGDRIVGFDETQNKLAASSVSFVGDNGERPIYRITTKRGRVVEVTGNHRFWCRTGRSDGPTYEWVCAEDLTPKSRIAVALGLPNCNPQTDAVATNIAHFIGIMVGDGHCRSTRPGLTTTSAAIRDFAHSVAQEHGIELKPRGDHPAQYRFHGKRANNKRNPIAGLIARYGLAGQGSRTKRVPPQIFSANEDAVFAFLSGYLDTDGHVGSNTVIWVSASRGLLSDVQHLLARVHVQSFLSPGRKTGFLCWRLQVADAISLGVLARRLTPLVDYKAAALSLLTDMPCLTGPVAPDRRNYDRVARIDVLPPQPTIGIEVNEVHTHVTDGLISHNTQQLVRWIDMDIWAAGGEPIDLEALRGRPCIGGLDLARINDLSSLALLFPPQTEGERWQVIWRHWCPEDNIIERGKRDRAPYVVWRDQGHLIATQGNTTDFRHLEAEILTLAAEYDIREIAFDRTFAGEVVRNLMDEGVQMVEFGQGFMSMGPATAEFTRMLLARELVHGNDPVATWCASNVTVRTDPAGNQKPDKERSVERIDAVVAAVMAVGRAMHGEVAGSYLNDSEILAF